jgi:glycosidase
MEWDKEKQNVDLFEHIQKLIHLRKENPLLANTGELFFIPAGPEDTSLAFAKSDGTKTVMVILNTSNENVEYAVPFNMTGKTITNLWNREEKTKVTSDLLTIPLQSKGFAIIEY